MNIEDRLKEAFEQEAEHLHAPHGSPDTAIRRGRRRRASNLIGGAALVLVLIGGTAAGVQLLVTPGEPTDENPAVTIDNSQAADESATAGSQVADFAWERVTLPKPEGARVWNIQVAANAEGFVAIGSGSTEGVSEEQLLVWDSPDGAEWSLTATTSPFDGPIDTLFNTGDGFVAVVRSFDTTTASTQIYSSPDGINWSAAAADLGPIGVNRALWFAGAASGNGATVLAGMLQTEPPQPPLIFEEAGVVLQQDNSDGTFAVSDLATGEVITVISSEAVYGGGPTVYGPDGEVILTLSEEVLAGAFGAGFEGVLSVEQDGIQIVIDYNEGTYVATDIGSETVVASGSEDELYRPGRIVVVNPATEETILDIDSEEFYQAQDDAWNDGREYLPQAELVVLATTDGQDWERIDLGSGVAEELNVSGIGFGPEGFLVSVSRFGPDRAGQEVWRSTDAEQWELLSSTDERSDGPIVSGNDAYYRLSFGNRAAVARSVDGSEWTKVYEPGNRGTYFNTIAAGGLGVVAIGQYQEENYGPPVVIAKDGRTLVVDADTGRITVTEDATGEVLTTIELDIYELEAPAQIIEDYEKGTIAITDIDGTVVMEFTEEEATAASEEAEQDYEYSVPEPAIAYSPDGAKWFTATTVGLEIAWAQGVAVGDNAVLIIGESADAYGELTSGSDGEYTVELERNGTLATLVPGEPYSPEAYVWVGRPR
jgi:hypothetical protein